jgi:hypothetical protein
MICAWPIWTIIAINNKESNCDFINYSVLLRNMSQGSGNLILFPHPKE